MNIGKLVREKMKQMSADCSGEYVDASGKHCKLEASDGGYTMSYGAGKQMEITKEQAMKLVSHSRKLSAEENAEK